MPKYRIQTDQGTYEVELAEETGAVAEKPTKGFWSGVRASLPSLEPSATVQQTQADYQAGNYGKAALGALRSTVEDTPLGMLWNAGKASVGQGQQAVQAARQGDYSRAALHGLGAVPVVGPMVAETAEAVANPETRSYGLGMAAGTAAQLAGPSALARLGAATSGVKLAGKLRASAEENIFQALSPTTKVNKALVRDKLAPGVVDRGLVATSREDLLAKAQAKMAEHGSVIDDFFDEAAQRGETMPAAPLLQSLDDARQKVMVQGRVLSVDRPYAGQLKKLAADLEEAQNAQGEIALGDLRRIRQRYDKTVGTPNFALPPAEKSKLGAIKDISDEIRGQFAQAHPELAAENKEFSFWQNLHDVTDAADLRRVGQTGGLRKAAENVIAAGAGISTHNPLTAMGTKLALNKLSQFTNGVLWNTLSAQNKAKVAALVQAGNAEDALAFAQKAAAASLAKRGPTNQE